MPVAERKVWVQELQATHQIGVTMICKVVSISRTAFYYQSTLNDDSAIIDALNDLVEKHQRWGFPKCFKRLRNRLSLEP